MHIDKKWIITSLFSLLLLQLIPTPVLSNATALPEWNDQWSYSKEIVLPIETKDSFAKYQPIDINIKFEKNCWGKSETEHSIRIVCWDGKKYQELESQIYNIEYDHSNYIKECNIVFLVPEFANGLEKYFVYYDDSEKPATAYEDHVEVNHTFYYYEPISGLKVDGEFYTINEDGYYIYTVGQQGDIVNRKLSQVVIKGKKFSKEFDITNVQQAASFAFSYHIGKGDDDEISSDQKLVSKKIITDGNLMVEFGIASETKEGHIRTTNVYKYYYCPSDNKRISVHCKHEIFEDIQVKGELNSDGRYGTILGIRSRSERIKKICFGEILPYIHINSENNQIGEYLLDPEPCGKGRNWIISYDDDCDLSENAWISTDEGASGRAYAVIFPSNQGFVKAGENEKDGIQAKVVENQFLNLVGTRVDYASVAFGRNSFEKGGSHDLSIPKGMIVEFDSEFFYSDQGGYLDVEKEADFYQKLAKGLSDEDYDEFKGEQNIYRLTVIPDLTGRFFSYPILLEKTNGTLPVIFIELYDNDSLLDSCIVSKPILGPAKSIFLNLAPGKYNIRVYRKTGENKKFIGFKTVQLEEDTTTHVYCTWQKDITINTYDQDNNRLKDVKVTISQGDSIVQSIVSNEDEIKIGIPFKISDPYIIKGFYKGFEVFKEKIRTLQKKSDIHVPIYDLTIQIKDKIDMSPGVDVKPFLTSEEIINKIKIEPDKKEKNEYTFSNLPSGRYQLQISYADTIDKKMINIPNSYDSEVISFTAVFNLETQIYDSHGNQLSNDNWIEIIRDGKKVINKAESTDILKLPPGLYTINVYSDGDQVGSKKVDLTNDKKTVIVTSIEWYMPLIIWSLILIFIIILSILLLIKRISLNSFLKIIAISMIIMSIFQPWWYLYGESDSTSKNSVMHILPHSVIETYTYDNTKFMDLGTIPEIFTGFVQILLIVIYSGIILLSASFIPNIFRKKRHANILIYSSILFLLIVVFAFSFGMSKISEITLGTLVGHSMIDTLLPNGKTVSLNTTWGLGIGFYLCVLAPLVALLAGIIDRYRTKRVKKK